MENVYFYRLEEIGEIIARLRSANQLVEKYTPTQAELYELTRFAEKYTYSGIILWYPPEQSAKIISADAYDYREGSIEKIFVIFNAELALDYDFDTPHQYISLWFEPNCDVRVPIRHAFCQHIFWHDEYSEVIDQLEIANQRIEEYEEYLRDHSDDDDDDNAYAFHWW